jgi:hypothetical protein
MAAPSLTSEHMYFNFLHVHVFSQWLSVWELKTGEGGEGSEPQNTCKPSAYKYY